ncbi:MAG: ATP-binding protein [Ruminococcus sp.]|nr:ATP-binding protein [Ruminococcus sp.]
MIDVLNMVAEKAAIANPIQADDYIKDGLLHCGKCHTRKQCWRLELPLSSGKKSLVSCTCECRENEFRQEDELKKRGENNIKRCKCFVDSDMATWCFENDDGQSDSHAMQVARNYVTNFERLKADGIGLLIHGDVGVGKSFMAACIANALIDKGENVMVTDFTTIIDDLWNCDTRTSYRRKLNDVSLLVIDDLGRENESKHNRGIIASVLDTRCRSKRPLILTSNLSPDSLRNNCSVDLKRIYSRIFELCLPVEFKGVDRRQLKSLFNKAKYQDILGL